MFCVLRSYSQAHNLFHIGYVVEGKPFEVLFFYFLYIFFVIFAQYVFFDACTLSCQYLFFKSAHR